jgi:hypothetical protein
VFHQLTCASTIISMCAPSSLPALHPDRSHLFGWTLVRLPKRGCAVCEYVRLRTPASATHRLAHATYVADHCETVANCGDGRGRRAAQVLEPQRDRRDGARVALRAHRADCPVRCPAARTPLRPGAAAARLRPRAGRKSSSWLASRRAGRRRCAASAVRARARCGRGTD